MHRVPVEAVVVGDCPLDERLQAMVEAAREAMGNAAKHSGARSVSVYAEVSADEVRVYVRDQGRGFDPAAVPASRRGIADSIEGRMERHGGTATIVSDGTEGTEVTLRMPRRPA
jgi:signal transduction histidine kinase